MILTRERLTRLLAVLRRQGGSETLRQLGRRFKIWEWEVEVASDLGSVEIVTRKPRIGRPSRLVRLLEPSESAVAKLPPFRWQLGRRIPSRHQMFAMRSVKMAVPRGCPEFGIPPIVDAYVASFPKARSRKAAYASASRLLRHRSVRVARAWHYDVVNGVVPKGERMPDYVNLVIERLRELGSERVA